MKALILDNKVVDIATETFPVAKSFKWVDCQSIVEIGWSYENGTFLPPVEEQIPLEVQLSILHENKLSEGLVLNGIPIRTDEKTIENLSQARLSAVLDVDFSVEWNFGNGLWKTLSSSDIINIYKAVETHKQECFRVKRVLLGKLESITDLEQEWNNEYNSI